MGLVKFLAVVALVLYAGFMTYVASDLRQVVILLYDALVSREKVIANLEKKGRPDKHG